MSSLSQRLDTLPFGAPHRRLLIGSGIGWALDAMDVGLISFVMAGLARDWGLSHAQLSLVASVGFVGMMLGASVGGILADRLGRRRVFSLTLVVYGVATGLSAFAPSLPVLLVLRFIVGLGLGAELPVASTLVSEFAPRAVRGRMIVALESFWAVGWILAATLGFFVGPRSIGDVDGWRLCLLVGVVPALYALYVRRSLPESVRFLQAQGRHQEAQEVVRSFARGVGASYDDVDGQVAAPSHGTSGASKPMGGAGVRALFAPEYRQRTIALWVVWFFINLAYYGAFIWLPSILVAQGFTMMKSFEYVLVMTLAQLPGYAAAAWLIERWGRRVTLSVFLLGSAGAAALFSLQHSIVGIVVAGCALSFFNLGAWGALYAVGPEIFPTAVRATGTGSAAGVGRVAAIMAPLAVPAVLSYGGVSAVFLLFGCAFVVAAAGAWALPDLTDRSMAGE